jgi:hypothetical protein
MSIPVELVLSKLPDAKRNGKGWSARCPAHDDRRPSLSITEGDDGRALICCHADKGCTPEAIVAALGLKLADLMPDDGVDADTNRESPRTRAIVSTAGRRAPKTFPSAREVVAELERRHGKRSGLWTYHDARGDPVGVIVRWETPKGKDIRPVARIGAQWIIGGMPEPRPLYRLPDLAGATRVYVTEGEKAADAARSLDLTATTSPHGAKSADKADWFPLAGKQVVILPDNDQPGKQYADTVAAILSKLTPAPIMKVVDLPNLPDHGDIADFVAGHSDVDRGELRRQVEALADASEAPELIPPRPAILPWRPFPVGMLPGVLRRIIEEIAGAIGCDVSYIAVFLLAVLGGAIGNTRRIRLKKSWCEPAVIWAVSIGESGTWKSPALKAVLEPIEGMERRAYAEYQESFRTHQQDKVLYEAALASWKRTKKTDDPPPEPPEVPVCVRYVVTDITVEALALRLVENPRGLLLARDELAGWLTSFNQYRAKAVGPDVPNWLSIHSAGPVRIDRKTGVKTTTCVPRAAVSVVGGIQPAVLQSALRPEYFQCGLAARLLLAMPPRRPRRWSDKEPSESALRQLESLYESLWALAPVSDRDGNPIPLDLPLTPQAKAVFVQFVNEHGREQAEDTSGDLSAAWSKLEGYAARFALIVHLVRQVAHDPPLESEGFVDADSMRAGVQLSRWFAQECRRVYAALGESDQERGLRQLVDLVQRRGGRITARELRQCCRRYRDSTDEAEAALNALVKAGVGQWEPIPPSPDEGGRPTRVFRLASVYVYETPTKPENDAGFVDVDNVGRAGMDRDAILSDPGDNGDGSDDWGAI